MGDNTQQPGGAPPALAGIVPQQPDIVAQVHQDLMRQGVGQGGGKFYTWKSCKESERATNAGQNLLFIMPQRVGTPAIGRPEHVHWVQYKKRTVCCVKNTFPEYPNVVCPVCAAMEKLSRLDNVTVPNMLPYQRFYVNVADFTNPQAGVQVAQMTGGVYSTIYGKLLSNMNDPNIQEGNKDFTYPLSAVPWEIHKLQKNSGKYKYESSLYQIAPRPIFVDANGLADYDVIQQQINTMPNLWEVRGYPDNEEMDNIVTISNEMLGYYMSQATQSVQVPINYGQQTQQPQQLAPAASMPPMPNQQPVQQTQPQQSAIQGIAEPGAVNANAPDPALMNPQQPVQQTQPQQPAQQQPVQQQPVQPQVQPQQPQYDPAPAATNDMNTVPQSQSSYSATQPVNAPAVTNPATPSVNAQAAPTGGYAPTGNPADSPQTQPPAAGLPTASSAQGASESAKRVCFNTNQYSPDRQMCISCPSKTECAEAQGVG